MGKLFVFLIIITSFKDLISIDFIIIASNIISLINRLLNVSLKGVKLIYFFWILAIASNQIIRIPIVFLKITLQRFILRKITNFLWISYQFFIFLLVYPSCKANYTWSYDLIFVFHFNLNYFVFWVIFVWFLCGILLLLFLFISSCYFLLFLFFLKGHLLLDEWIIWIKKIPHVIKIQDILFLPMDYKQ